MAHFWRLIALVLVLIGSHAAHADVPAVYQYGWSRPAVNLYLPPVYSTANDACQAGVELNFPDRTYVSFDGGDPGASSASCKANDGGGWVGPIGQTFRSLVCPTGSESSGGSCVCIEGFYEDGAQCKPVPDCGVGSYWNGSACEPIPDPPLCNPPKVIIGDQCMLPPDPDDPCPPPNVLQPDGSCVPPCPPGLSRIDGVCKCPEGKVYIDGQCKDPECNHPLGTNLGYDGQQFTSSTYDGGLFCHASCVVYPTFSGRDPVSGKWFATGPLTSTGGACTGTSGGGGLPPGEDPTNPNPGDPPPPEEPPKSCSKGRCPGTVNGVTVCVPCSDTSSTSSGSTSPGGTIPGNGADGTGGPGQPGGPPGSSSTSTSTTCKDGKCTTTTTTSTTGEDGQAVDTKTETKEETKEDFCTENPKSPHCVDGSFGGACDGGFTCEGDPVACATAKAANEQACMLKVDPANSILGIGNNALGGGNGDDHPRGLTVVHDVGVLDQTNPWGGSCPSDIQVSVMGNNVTIPLSELCTALQAMGAIAVAFTLMAAAFIVVKGT